MGTLKKYRFRLAWQNYRVGQVIEPPAMLAGWLLSNGYVEPVSEPAVPDPPAKEAAPPRHKRQRVSP